GRTEAWFVRANARRGLLEAIELHAGKHHVRGARWGDTAFAGVRIALTPGRFTSPKGMVEYQMLTNWADTRTREQAVAWKRVVVATAAPRLDSLWQTHGEDLLARTAAVRAAVDRYLGLLDRQRSVAELIGELTARATEEELREARRLARTEVLI